MSLFNFAIIILFSDLSNLFSISVNISSNFIKFFTVSSIFLDSIEETLELTSLFNSSKILREYFWNC